MRQRLMTVAILAWIWLAPMRMLTRIDSGSTATAAASNTASVFDGEISGGLETAKLYGVLSMSDNDIEIDGQVESGDEAIRAMRITGPTGNVVQQITFDDNGTAGEADLQFATPELALEAMQAAYPAGEYEFRVRTVSGKLLASTWTLTYDFATAPVLVFPANDDTGVSRHDLVVRWNAVPAAGIRFEIENPRTLVALKVDLPGTATEFAVPANWLDADTEYIVDVKVVGSNGNLIVRDVTFTTGT